MKMKFKVDNKQKFYATTDFDKHLVRINKTMAKKSGRKGELLDSIKHELVHIKNPKLGERKVIKKTARLVKGMGKKTKARLYAKVGKKRV